MVQFFHLILWLAFTALLMTLFLLLQTFFIDLPNMNTGNQTTSLRFVHNNRRKPQRSTSILNDDYCDDVAEGLDEPLTTACAGYSQSKFLCTMTGNYISSSRVRDGVCDCCDGEDEQQSPFNVKCAIRCVLR